MRIYDISPLWRSTIGFGDTPFNVSARRKIRLNAEPWAGVIMHENQPSSWGATFWPFGALAACQSAFKFDPRIASPEDVTFA